MNKSKVVIVFFVILFIVVLLVNAGISIYQTWTRPNPPAEMIQGMSNSVDGDSLLIVYRERLDTLFNTRGVGTLKIEYAGETQYWFQVEGYEIKNIDSLHSAIIIKQRY